MIGLHPDTGATYAMQRNAELVAEAERAYALRHLADRSLGRRLAIAAGRLLERAGSRLQQVPAKPLTWQHPHV